ncbi:unnamed protein product [Owenia fusiformis]|uniref:Amine oxidase n=1 Tax=Owenia fusiformis TaxID=6347 RepID=A0A8S4Q5N1_OWEFU|nr:unnamed protein product [Owenia fusiformis]
MNIWIGEILFFLVYLTYLSNAKPNKNEWRFKVKLPMDILATQESLDEMKTDIDNKLDELKAAVNTRCTAVEVWSEWGACNKTCGAGGVRSRTSDSGEQQYEKCTLPDCSKELDLGEACLPGYSCSDPNAECKDVGDGVKCACKASFIQKRFHNVLACTEATTQTTSVIVLGGGIAGVMAAKTLYEAGVTDIILVEAQSQLGGRISHIDWNGYTIEKGASWIQGLDGNPIWDLVQKFDLSGMNSHHSDKTVRDANGNDVTEEVDLSYTRLEAAQEFEDELAIKKLQSNSNDISKMVALRLGGWTAKSNFDYAIEYLKYDFEYAENIDTLSLKYGVLFSYWDFEDGDFRVIDPRGYRHLVQATAADFLNETNTMLNETVSKVETLKNRVRITLDSGVKIEAAYAIMTFSLGVLQNEKVTFEPPFSYEKKEAINAFKMSHFTRIVMKFPYAFWDETEYVIYAAKRPGYYVIWENLNHSRIHPGSNILMSTLTGDEAKRIASLTEAEIVAENMGVLRSMYGANIPDPISVLVNTWLDNPLTMGSYSNWPIGFDEDDHDVMTAPIGNLHFAGEHTNARYYGYTHGAYMSGVDAATNVVDCVKFGC